MSAIASGTLNLCQMSELNWLKCLKWTFQTFAAAHNTGDTGDALSKLLFQNLKELSLCFLAHQVLQVIDPVNCHHNKTFSNLLTNVHLKDSIHCHLHCLIIVNTCISTHTDCSNFMIAFNFKSLHSLTLNHCSGHINNLLRL